MKNQNKLDIAAKVFPSVSNKNNSSVFRVAVVLKDEIDKHCLQLALNMIYERYKLFFLRLRRGVFWEYFDTNYFHCIVEEENDIPCSQILSHENNGYILKVLYYKNRISVEAFHSVTDGSGIIEFLKSLVYYYICIKYKQINSQGKILLFDQTEKNDDDSFSKHFGNLTKDKNFKIKKRIPPLKLKGKVYSKGGHSVITGTISVRGIKNYCKKQNCTITSFLIANMIWAINQEKPKNKKPIVISVPVNLRKIFQSNTLKNFFSVVKIAYKFTKITTFENVLTSVSKQLEESTKQGFLKQNSRQNVLFTKNILSRHTPLVLKNVLIPIGFNYIGELSKTITLSNVGIMDFPDQAKEYIKHAEVLNYPSKKCPISCAVCSFDDELSISFIKSIKEIDIIKSFFTCLSKRSGCEVSVYSNMWGEDYE